jgi:hypothetical protein
VLRVPVTPAMIEPGDLFGHVDTAQRRFIPHPAGPLQCHFAVLRSTLP